MQGIGKYLIYAGALLVCAGILVSILNRFGIHPGKLPGDLFYKKGNTMIYFPITTSLLISLILSLVFWLFKK